MPGIPTKFVVADLAFDELRKSGAPQAKVLNDPKNLPFAYLGVIGARLGDLVAARPERGAAAPNTRYFRVWLPVLRLLAGNPAQNGQPERRGIYRDLKQLRDTLAKLAEVIKSEDKFALIGMKDEVDQMQAAIQDVQALVGALNVVRLEIGLAILMGGPTPKVAPTKSWEPRDTLHWSHTGRFLKELTERAQTSNDDRLKAYALGAIIGYAVDLCGNPYINSVVGAPYRNHWWRHRWIANYVDTWVYGYYRSGGADKVSVGANGLPDPKYTYWPNVCGANLQKYIELPGITVDKVMQSIHDNAQVPAVLPKEFLTFWKAAYEKAYGKPDPGSGVDDDGLQSAYAMTWLILWLQTSGEVIPCMPVDQINYPDECGSKPDWVAEDGSVVVDGQVQAPPMPQNASKPSVWKIISGIVLAILGLLTWNAGAVARGIAEIAGAVALIVDGATEPDWDQLRCHVGWVLVYLYNKTNALHDLLKWAGLGFPYTLELAHNPIYLELTGSVIPPDAALSTVRSNPPHDNYPASRWNATGSDWANPPAEPLEPPVENAYPSEPTWPYHFTDGLRFVANQPPQQVNALQSLPGQPPLVRDPNEWNARRGKLAIPRAIDKFFGNAVQVSLDLIQKAQPKEFLDWDLDGDPGIGFPTWLLPTAISPRSNAIPEP